MENSVGIPERLRAAEAIAHRVFRRVGRYFLDRWPMLPLIFVYTFLALATPPQLVEVLADFAVEARPPEWMLPMIPLVFGACGQVALLSARVRPHASDPLLANAPALLLIVIVFRWAPALMWTMIAASVVGVVLAHSTLRYAKLRPTRLKWLSVLATLATFLMAVALTAASPLAFPRFLGPLTLLTSGLTFAGLLLAVSALRPMLAGLYILACAAAAWIGGGTAPVPAIKGSDAPPSGYNSVATAMEAWVRSRPNLDEYRRQRRPYPIVVASAEGGGIYAASHAYLALSAMQVVCPSFATHLFATVGVSGGAVGTLLFSADAAARAPNGRLQPCRPRTRAVEAKILSADLLSPPLANLLFLQLADFLIPGPAMFPEGGETIASAVADMLPGNVYVRAPLRASWRPNGTRPATIFVATDVHSGNRFVISPFGNGSAANAETFPSGTVDSPDDIAAHRAALISARFPWLTSTARLRVSENSQRILADGGYFENAGAETAMDVIAAMREAGRRNAACEAGDDVLGDFGDCRCPIVVQADFSSDADWGGCRIPVFIAYMPIAGTIDGIPGYVYKDAPDPSQSYLGDPLSTMLRARTARGILALDRARRAFAGPKDPDLAQGTSADLGFFPHYLPIEELKLPLGWKLSRRSLAAIEARAAPTHECGLRMESGQLVGDEGPGNGCEMKMMAWLFNPSLDERAHGIPGFGGG